jgi:hypothetical protein
VCLDRPPSRAPDDRAVDRAPDRPGAARPHYVAQRVSSRRIGLRRWSAPQFDRTPGATLSDRRRGQAVLLLEPRLMRPARGSA